MSFLCRRNSSRSKKMQALLRISRTRSREKTKQKRNRRLFKMQNSERMTSKHSLSKMLISRNH
nr:MAG TPA: hypothetical protein [Bacteriophage sp.]